MTHSDKFRRFKQPFCQVWKDILLIWNMYILLFCCKINHVAKACFKWLFQNQAHALKICYAKFNIVHFFIIWQKWTEGKMKKKIYFLSVLSTVNTVFLMQYICKEKKKKQSQLLFSILNNYNIYKLFRITNTQTHTHSQTHASTYILSYLWFYIECW